MEYLTQLMGRNYIKLRNELIIIILDTIRNPGQFCNIIISKVQIKQITTFKLYDVLKL